MSRQLVSVVYRNDRALALDPDSGEVVREFVPETIIGVGNSIGGYYLRGCSFNKETRVELVRVSGPEKYVPIESIWNLTKGRKGEEVRPGLMLMAISSGAARNGVFHRYNAPRTPLEYALKDRGCSFRIVDRIDTINIEVSRGGNLCSHSTSPGDCWADYKTDGSWKCIQDGEYVKATESYGNQFHIGCMCSSATYRIQGGTFVMQTLTTRCSTSVTRVTITPEADLEKVAQAVRNA